MTAVRRMGILERTLRSFKEGLFKDHDCRLIINVDPVGEEIESLKVVLLCEEFFPVFKFRCPNVPSFPSAFKWVWLQTENDFVFNLEDDWELVVPVNLDNMVALMRERPRLAVLRLPKWRTDIQSSKNWSTFFPWNGSFFECPAGKRAEMGFCGHPSLLRGDFVRKTAASILESANPEKQFHYNRAITREVLNYDFGVFSAQNSPPAIVDIGGSWRGQNGWKKAGNRAHFVSWCRV